MKILYLTSIKEVHFKFFLDLSRKYNHEVHLIGGNPEYNNRKEIKHHKLGKFKAKLNYFLIQYPALVSFSFNKTLLKKVIDKEKPDIIHALGADIWGTLATSFTHNIPVVISTTGSDIFQLPFQNKFIYKNVRNALQNADYVHTTISDLAVEHLKSCFHIHDKKIISLSWGIDCKKIEEICSKTDKTSVKCKYGILENDFLIFAPRGMRKVFSPIFNLIPVAKEMKNKGTKFKVLIKMTGSDAKMRIKFKERVMEDNLTDRFIFIEDNLEYAEMISLFYVSDLMVSLAESDQIATAILEGFITETIIILSDLPVYKGRFLQPESVFFVDNRDEVNLLNTINYIHKNFTRLKNEKVNTNKNLLSSFFNRDTSMEKFNSLYKSL